MVNAEDSKRAFVAVGSNLGNRIANCRKAVKLVCQRQGVNLDKVSGFYETAPVDIDSDNWFINGVFSVLTTLSPVQLLELLLQVEGQMGRDRAKGPDRIIDLDLLSMEGVSRRPNQESNLELPHPRFADRPFVLVPWSEIAPDLVVEGYSMSISQLLSCLDFDPLSIKKVEDF